MILAAGEGVLPAWAQIVLGLAAVVTALGVLWSKVLKPGAKLISTTEEMLPLLRNLTATFRATPEYFTVLREIAGQFQADSGSSLRDVVNRLEATAIATADRLDSAATELRNSDQMLKVGVETTKQLANADRETQRQLMLVVDRLNTKIDEITASGVRIELDRERVAENLTARELTLDAGTEGVAENLAADKRRADESAGPTGAAADAAVTTIPPSDREERRRQRREEEEARRAAWDLSEESDEEETGEPPPAGATPTGEER